MLGIFRNALTRLVLGLYPAGSKRISHQAIPGCELLSGDGAWCWIQDPRAVYIEGRHKRTYAGWVTRTGGLQIGYYDHETGNTEYFTLRDDWDIDDHGSNSFLVLPDKRLMAFYARHNKKGLFSRTASQPEDISMWEGEVTVADTPGITYSQPVYLSEENRIYVFWRGESWKPTFACSGDGVRWSEPGIMIREQGREDGKIRPYMKVASDGRRAIHFAFTDGHPRDEPLNSIYYLRYEKGAFYRADGAKAGDMNSLPIPHNMSDIVYDAKATKIRAWIWDIAVDREGLPVIVYTRLPGKEDHRYHYARWRNGSWHDVEITAAGRWFPQTSILRYEPEPYYSGGIALDHSNPSVVYLSRQVNDMFEIEKWTTADKGAAWLSKPVTGNSKHPNIRPVVPRGYPGKGDHVLWMCGDYKHFTKYGTAIRMLKPETRVAQP